MNSLLTKVFPFSGSQPVKRLRDHLQTPLFLNAYLLIINQGLSAALGMLYWMAAARFYSTDFVGKGSAIISTLGFLEVLAEFSLKSAMQRFIPRAGAQVRKMVLAVYGVVLVTTAVFTVGFFALGHLLHFADNLLAGLPATTLILLVLANMLYTIFVVQDGVLMGLHQTKWVVIENTLYNLLKMGLLVIGIFGLIGSRTGGGIVASWFIPAPLLVLLVSTLIFARFIPRFQEMDRAPVEPVTPRQVVRMVTGDHLGTVLSETSIRLLPLLVLNLLGTSANAFFYQAWLIGMMLYLLSWNVAASFSVEGSAEPEKLAHYSHQSLRQILFLILPVSLVVIAGAPLILSIFGPAYARAGTSLLRWLALAAIPYGFNAWFLSYSRVRMEIRPVILLQGLQCVITLGLSYWWLPRYGISSIGVAWLIAQTTLSLLALARTRRVLFARGSAQSGPAGEVKFTQPDGALIPQTGFSFLSPNLNDRETPGSGAVSDGKVYLFLSPHLDDAVLSCGGLIARLGQAGDRVVVASIFTADVTVGEPVSWLAQRNLRSWGLEAAAAPFALRCTEDTAATCHLGAESIHLGFHDALYRRSPEGELYYPMNTVGVPLDPEDRQVTGRAVEEQLKALASQLEAEPGNGLRVFVPLGLGGHVDHILIRACAEAIFDQADLFYYEEMPYAARAGVQVEAVFQESNSRDGQAAARWLPVRVDLTPEEIEARIDAAAAYTSQVPGLFPSPVRRNLEILSTRAPAVSRPLWLMYQQRARQEDSRTRVRERMAQTIKRYIRRVGGENYWYLASPAANPAGEQGARVYGKE